MRGFSRMIVPAVFGPKEQREHVVAAGRRIATRGFEIIDAGLSGKTYVADRYSYADAALFYVERWAEQFSMPMPANCRQHYETMKKRARLSACSPPINRIDACHRASVIETGTWRTQSHVKMG